MSQTLIFLCYIDIKFDYALLSIFILLGAFYFVLGNLCPQFCSVVNMIQLVALCPVPYISTYGMDKILQPFMTDIRLLESVSIKILCLIVVKFPCAWYIS